ALLEERATELATHERFGPFRPATVLVVADLPAGVAIGHLLSDMRARGHASELEAESVRLGRVGRRRRGGELRLHTLRREVADVERLALRSESAARQRHEAEEHVDQLERLHRVFPFTVPRPFTSMSGSFSSASPSVRIAS